MERVVSAVRSLLHRDRLEQLPPRDPYLQGVTASYATITWVEDEHGVGAIEYGETPRFGRERVDPNIGRRHAVVLTDLDRHHLLLPGEWDRRLAGSVPLSHRPRARGLALLLRRGGR